MPEKPSIDIAETVKNSLDGFSVLIPIADKHQKGSRFVLTLIGLVGTLILAGLLIQRIEVIDQDSPLIKKDSGINLIKKIKENADGTQTFELNDLQ